MRKRNNQILYDDGLTDKQFTRLMDGSVLDDSTDIGQPDMNTLIFQKKIKKQENKTKLLQNLKENELKTNITEYQQQLLIKHIKNILKIIKLNGSELCYYFKEKPLKKLYPDYYLLIHNPISINDILIKLKKLIYINIYNIELDFLLISYNAKLFNTELSDVFMDAENIRTEFYKSIEIIFQRKFEKLKVPNHWNDMDMDMDIGLSNNTHNNNSHNNNNNNNNNESMKISLKRSNPNVPATGSDNYKIKKIKIEEFDDDEDDYTDLMDRNDLNDDANDHDNNNDNDNDNEDGEIVESDDEKIVFETKQSHKSHKSQSQLQMQMQSQLNSPMKLKLFRKK